MDFLWVWLQNNGVSTAQLESMKYLVLLIILLPIIFTLLGISRHIIGIKSLNAYVPVLLTYVLLEIGRIDNNEFDFVRGAVYGSILFLISIIISGMLYRFLKRFRMHYIPKLSILITGVTLAYIFIIALTVLFERNLLLTISPLAIIILILIGENVMAVYAKKSFRYAFSISIETLLISIFSFGLISIETFRNLVMNNLLILVLVVILNVYVGRFIGLRLTEYWRFRTILFSNYSEDDINKPNNKK